MSAVIAVPTGGRREELGRLLTRLARDYGVREDVGLVVVDNDPAGGAREVFEETTSAFAGRRRYAHEPRRGYSSARNAVLTHSDGARAIALIDDDEIPAAGWLDELLAAQAMTGADVVAGPVVSEFPPGVPDWYERSGVFSMDAPDFADGDEMPWCASNNTLVMRSAITAVPEGFDAKFNPMSGEDTEFFLKARLRGCRIVWTNRAVVHEFLQPHRFNRRWLFQRAIRSGNTRALVELRVIGGPSVVAMRAVKALGMLGLGSGAVILGSITRDRARALRGLYRLGLAWGMLLGFQSSQPWGPSG